MFIRRCRAVSLSYPRLPFRQRQRVPQSHGGEALNAADRTDQVASAALQRQRLVESKNGAVIRKHMGYTHMLLPTALQSLFELPPALRTTRDQDRRQRQAEAGVPPLPDALGIFREVARGRQLSQARAEAGGSGPHCPGGKRHGGGPPDAASQAEAVCQFLPRTRRAEQQEEGCGNDGRWKTRKTKTRFPFVSHRPWKSLRDSHNPTTPALLAKTQNQKARKEPQRLKKPQPPSSGSSFDEKMPSCAVFCLICFGLSAT